MGKKDENVQNLIHPEHNKQIDFLFFAQSKIMRMQYMRMKMNTMKAMHSPISNFFNPGMNMGMPNMGMPLTLPGMNMAIPQPGIITQPDS